METSTECGHGNRVWAPTTFWATNKQVGSFCRYSMDMYNIKITIFSITGFYPRAGSNKIEYEGNYCNTLVVVCEVTGVHRSLACDFIIFFHNIQYSEPVDIITSVFCSRPHYRCTWNLSYEIKNGRLYSGTEGFAAEVVVNSAPQWQSAVIAGTRSPFLISWFW